MIGEEEQARSFVANRCNAGAMDRLDRLTALLREENTRQNLVSGPSLSSVWQRHIADSAQLLDHVSRETPIWLDLGTGAGFPGLVIACLRPNWQVHLVESRKRRIEWLEAASSELDLANCQVKGQKLEDVAPFAVDVLSARAFAPLTKLIALAERFSTSDTQWLLPKGRSAAQEVSELPDRLRNMFHVEQSVTSEDSGIVVGRIAKGTKR